MKLCLLAALALSGCSGGSGWHAGATGKQKVAGMDVPTQFYENGLGMKVEIPAKFPATCEGEVLTVKGNGCSCEYIITAYPNKDEAVKAGLSFIGESEPKVKTQNSKYYLPEEFADARKGLPAAEWCYFADWIPDNIELGILAAGDSKRGYTIVCHNHGGEGDHFAPNSFQVKLK